MYSIGNQHGHANLVLTTVMLFIENDLRSLKCTVQDCALAESRFSRIVARLHESASDVDHPRTGRPPTATVTRNVAILRNRSGRIPAKLMSKTENEERGRYRIESSEMPFLFGK